MRRQRLISLGLLLATVAVYWPVAHCEYTNFDDWAYAGENPFVRQGLTLTSVRYAFTAIFLGNWHPVTWLSHMLDCQLFGDNAGAHHLVNLFFHAANTLLLFHLLQRMTRELWPSAMVAALFALHPLHVESVAWIAERKDVLSTLFGLLSIWAYLRYAEKRSRAEQGRKSKAESREPKAVGGESNVKGSPLDARRSTLDYLLALLFFALGLMSKPMLVTWPFVLLLLDFWPLRRVPGWVSGIRYQGSGVRGQGSGPAKKALTTSTLNPQPPTLSQPSTFARLILEKVPFFTLSIASSVVAVIAQRLSGAVPDWGLITVSMRVNNALISYVRYLGKTFWPDHLAIFYPYRFEWPAWIILGSVTVLAFGTLGAVWQRKRRPWLLFGWLWFLGTLVPVIGLVQIGSQSMADRYMYIPSIGLFLVIVLGAKELLSRWTVAPKHAGWAVATAALLGCLFVTRAQLVHWRSSETLFRRTLEVTGENVMAEYGLGDALVRKGNIDEGLMHLERAVQLKSDCAPALIKIADLWSRRGKTRESIAAYREGLRYQSNNVAGLNNLAWLLATSEDPAVRNGPEAVRLAEYACESLPYQSPVQAPSHLDTLAAAYAEAGRFDDAVKTAEKARDLALASGQKEKAERIQHSLELYRDGKPLRQAVKAIQSKPH